MPLVDITDRICVARAAAPDTASWQTGYAAVDMATTTLNSNHLVTYAFQVDASAANADFPSTSDRKGRLLQGIVAVLRQGREAAAATCPRRRKSACAPIKPATIQAEKEQR